MMGGGYGNMMSGFGAYAFFGFLISLVIIIDLVLLGIWLWKEIEKKQ